MGTGGMGARRVAPALGLPASLAGDDRWCAAATRAGQLDVLARAVALGAPLDVALCWSLAIERGKVEVMAWLRGHDPEECAWDTEEIEDEDGTRIYGGPCVWAADYGQLAALQWLRDPARDGGPDHAAHHVWITSVKAASNIRRRHQVEHRRVIADVPGAKTFAHVRVQIDLCHCPGLYLCCCG